MKKLIIAVAFALSACGVGTEGTIVTEARGQRSEALNQLPFGLCELTCGSGPTVPPDGQTCTLVSDTCENGVRYCVWDCQPTPPPPPPNPRADSRPPPIKRLLVR